MGVDDKNNEKLVSFIAFCRAHPEQRFWQALRNWAGVSFVYTSDVLIEDRDPELHDTFYDE